MYKKLIKRLLDVCISLVGLIILSPLILLMSFTLLISYKASPFFVQTRPGYKGVLFRVFKFKTMKEHRSNADSLKSDAERLTKIGRFIRKTSLDEIPQLYNVLKGDMSLIGPRPLLFEYLTLYNARQARRHEVKPGITGWAQVNGRNTLSWERKFDMDVWYVDNVAFSLDMRIFLLTIYKVIKREGITSFNSTTMERFKGNK